MLVSKNHYDPRLESTCRCGQKSHAQIGNRDFFIGTKKITIHNIPYFYCTHCERVSYDGKLNIDEFLKYAYRNNFDNVDWNQNVPV